MNRDYTGKNFDPNRCASSAQYGGRWSSTVQCSRKPQPGGRYCKQHDPDKIKNVEAIKSEVYDASSAVRVAKHRVLAAALEEELDTTKLAEARKLYPRGAVAPAARNRSSTGSEREVPTPLHGDLT